MDYAPAPVPVGPAPIFELAADSVARAHALGALDAIVRDYTPRAIVESTRTDRLKNVVAMFAHELHDLFTKLRAQPIVDLASARRANELLRGSTACGFVQGAVVAVADLDNLFRALSGPQFRFPSSEEIERLRVEIGNFVARIQRRNFSHALKLDEILKARRESIDVWLADTVMAERLSAAGDGR